MFPFFWLIAFSLSILPCAILLGLSFRFNIRSFFICVIASIIVGVCGDAVLVMFLHNVHWYTDSPSAPQLTKWREFLNTARIFIPVSVAGGLAFRIYAVKSSQKTISKRAALR